MKPMRIVRLAGLLAPSILAAMPGLLAQDKANAKPGQVQLTTAWPKLTKADKAKGTKWLGLLASKKPEIQEKAEAQLLALGAGMGRSLFLKLTDSPNKTTNDQIARILDQILQPEHVTLIAGHAKHKSTFGRRYVMRTLARIGRPESVPTFVAGRKDKDIEVAYYAALGLIKTRRDKAALVAIRIRCEEEWDEIGEEVSEFLTVARHREFEPWLRESLASKEITEQIATLRLMRALAPSSAKGLVRPFLDSEHSILKKEAINALRVIVDGHDPIPLKKITVFRVIKLAKEWRARIG